MSDKKMMMFFSVIVLLFSFGTIIINSIYTGGDNIVIQMIRFILTTIVVIYFQKGNMVAYKLFGILLILGGGIGLSLQFFLPLKSTFSNYYMLIMSGFNFGLGIRIYFQIIVNRDVFKILCDFSLKEIIKFSRISYRIYGSAIITLRFIFHGLQLSKKDIRLICTLADFFVEMNSTVSPVLFYYIYENKDKLEEEELRRFLIMFSSAMNRFGLSSPLDNMEVKTLEETMEYDRFEYDFDSLEGLYNQMCANYGSFDNFLLLLEKDIGRQCGFIKDSEQPDTIDLSTGPFELSQNYNTWINDYPSELNKIRRAFK